MNYTNFSLGRPELCCTFTAANNTPAASYPWTDPGDIRPYIGAVAQQFVVGGGLDWQLTSNQLINRAGGLDTAVAIQLKGRARRVIMAIEDDVGAVGSTSGTSIIIRANADLSQYLRCSVLNIIGGTWQFHIQTESGASMGSATFTPAITPNTNQLLEVIDTGSQIMMLYSGQRFNIVNSTYSANHGVGVHMDSHASQGHYARDIRAWL